MNHIASPDNLDASIERLIQAKGRTAARVTPADIKANIVSAHYFTAAEGVAGESWARLGGVDLAARQLPQELSLLTICVLVLKNGFTVMGKSACASPENFDAEIGRRVAYANAEQEIWPLMGYALKEQLHASMAIVDDGIARIRAAMNADRA